MCLPWFLWKCSPRAWTGGGQNFLQGEKAAFFHLLKMNAFWGIDVLQISQALLSDPLHSVQVLGMLQILKGGAGEGDPGRGSMSGDRGDVGALGLTLGSLKPGSQEQAG